MMKDEKNNIYKVAKNWKYNLIDTNNLNKWYILNELYDNIKKISDEKNVYKVEKDWKYNLIDINNLNKWYILNK